MILPQGLYCIWLALFLFLAPATYGQSTIDSLQNALEEANGLPRAKILLELASHSRQTDVEKAIYQTEEALAIAKRHGDEELQSESLSRLGFYHQMIDQDTTALEYFLSALNIERLHGHRLAQADILHELGRFYTGQENYAKALNYYFQALRISQEEEAKSSTANTLLYIGNAYRKRGTLDQAVSFYKRSSALAQEVNDQRILAMAAAKAGINLHKLGKFDDATTYFEHALEAAKALHSIHAQAGILLAMSSAYKDQNLYKKALTSVTKQLKLAKSHESKMLQARGFENLAGLYEAKGNLEQSNKYLLKSIGLYKAIAFPLLPVGNKLMQNYLQQGQITKAIQTGEQVLNQTKGSAQLQDKEMLFETLVEAYIQRGDYHNALKVQSKLIAVQDSLFDRKKSQQIAEMQARYETQQKEQQIALLQKEQEKAELMRNAFAAGLILIVIIGFLIYNRQRLKINKNKTDLENNRLQEQQLTQDLEFKNKQLTTHSLNLVQKNEVMKELKQRITNIQENQNGQMDKELRKLQHLVDYSFNLDEDWEEFRLYFEEVHTGFFDALKDRCPDLTTNELRLSALVKLNLTIKEIATILSISPDSVKTARYRLRKKLDLSTKENLTDFMMDVERDVRV